MTGENPMWFGKWSSKKPVPTKQPKKFRSYTKLAFSKRANFDLKEWVASGNPSKQIPRNEKNRYQRSIELKLTPKLLFDGQPSHDMKPWYVVICCDMLCAFCFWKINRKSQTSTKDKHLSKRIIEGVKSCFFMGHEHYPPGNQTISYQWERISSSSQLL